MAVVKANYVKRGKGDKGRAKATIRYNQHRRDRDGERVSRSLFGYDGALSREQAYRMIDEAPRGTIFYRIVLSPDPKREDRFKDLELSDITLHTMLTLEERLGKQIQFIAATHDDHSPHRHVHTLVLVQRKLTLEDFQALRQATTERALFQRQQRDRIRTHRLSLAMSRSNRLGRQPQRRFYRLAKPYQSYTCPLCHYHQALPTSRRGYRCPACGLWMRREWLYGLEQARYKERGLGLELSLSP
jgi:hypothetical protein